MKLRLLELSGKVSFSVCRHDGDGRKSRDNKARRPQRQQQAAAKDELPQENSDEKAARDSDKNAEPQTLTLIYDLIAHSKNRTFMTVDLAYRRLAHRGRGMESRVRVAFFLFFFSF